MNAALSSTEAQRRLAEFGPNEIRREEGTSSFTLLARQFTSAVIWLLLGASVLSASLGELVDAIAIPAAQAVFQIGPLSAADCGLTLLVALGPVTLIEVSKLVRRWHTRWTSPRTLPHAA